MKYITELAIKPEKRSLALLASYLAITIPISWAMKLFFELPWPDWLVPLLNLFGYLIIALLIIEEKASLGNSHIDRWSLFIFLVFGSVLRPITLSGRIGFWFGFIVFCSIAFSLFIKLRRSEIQVSETRRLGFWVLTGVLVGGVGLILLNIRGFSHQEFPDSPSVTIAYFLYYFWHFLCNTAIQEEFVFRGFLWGIMLRYGYKNKQILVISSILFTLIHARVLIDRSVPSLIGGVVFSLMLGLLAWKSRSLVPSIVAHAIHNTVAFILNLFS